MRLVDHLRLNESVEFKWNLTELEKRDVLKSCRALVLPSSVEGFGIVVLEGNACGVPVVASSGVPSSVVKSGYNGLRYPFGDITLLGERLVSLLTDDELHRGLSREGLEFVRGYAWHKVSPRFERVLQRAAAGANVES